jgi:two-component system CheB/CheR fusion protein
LTLEAGRSFEAVLEYLRDNRGFDFTGYKRPTLTRRVEARCRELGLDDYNNYLDYLQVHAEEFAILFDKILINVTDFFRDKPAWDHLAQNIVPRIVARKGNIRIWSTGTASGEEAYTAAIVFCEALGEDEFLRRVKIYATDIDEGALNRARAGYSTKELESIEPSLVRRYFEPQGEVFVFRTALRKALIFGRHDLVQDAPISRLDLLICRNTLMYFTAETQTRILARFHFALNDDGYLFLGRAEMLLTHTEIFSPVDLKQRIFTKVPQLQLRDRLAVLAQSGSTEAANRVAGQVRLHELAVEGTPYPQVVIDAPGNIVVANQIARRTFDLRPDDMGRPLKDLEFSYKPADLRSPIDRALRERQPQSIDGIDYVAVDGRSLRFDVKVVPLLDEGGLVAGVSLTFVDATEVAHLMTDLEKTRREVQVVSEELQSSNEELETTNEELQSTVEELETTNEELQSTNEELETMNEELESTNSELNAINADLRQRTDEIVRLNTFLLAITGAIELGAVVLDPELNVQVWNERAADLWGVRSDEVVGRRFFDLDIGLPTDAIRDMIGSVMSGKPPYDERILRAVNRRGRSIECRVMATALTGGNRPGVVLVMEELKETKEPAG